MITTSKYEENGFADIIRGLVKVYDPKIIVELGTQQGASAIILGRHMTQGKLWTFDTYLDDYDKPPYAHTQASFEAAKHYVHWAGLDHRINVCCGDAYGVHFDFEEVDILHIDLCNHYDNMSVILPHWRYRVKNCIILEGGGYNKWQREHGFKPFFPLLRRHFVTDNFDVSIIKKNEDYALTILTSIITRRSNDTDVQSENGPDGIRVGSWRVRVWDGGGRSEGSRTYECPKEIPECGEPVITE